jgi:hypothetical protein
MGENKLLLILLGVTLLGAIGLVAWGMSVGGSVEEKEMGERQQLVSKIDSIRAPYKNTETIEADKERVRVVLDSLAAVKETNRQWNSRNYTIPTLSLVGGRQAAALPYDPSLWKDNELLRFNFVRDYHTTLSGYIESLSPTSPPTVQQVQDEALRQQERIDYRRAVEEKQDSATDRPTAPAGRDMGMGMGEMMPRGSVSRTPSGSNAQAGDEALKIAEANLNLQSSMQGKLYATRQSFDPVVPYGSESIVQLDAQQVWVIMVARWVQRDIAAAISQTNDEVLAGSGQSASVPASAIKRLFSVRVGIEQSAGGRTLSPEQSSEQDGSGSMSPDMRMGGRGSRSSRSRSSSEPVKSDTLTEYSKNKLFDVVQYEFTVLMPVRLLPLLEKNLARQNYHIIVNEQILSPDSTGEEATRGGRSRATTPGRTTGEATSTELTDLYYYGTQPVHKVTITAQLLLTTEFTRGVWDAKQEAWVHPPLMPVSLMRQLPEPVLRPQDEKLLKGDLPMPWAPSASDESSDRPGQPR